jgi:dolichol-phosphate mannosyltransferase
VIAAAAILVALTVLRAYAAFNVPLTADEAYYWTWSLHPAYGYTDHPPMVAWLIGLGTTFGQGPGFVRLPFVLCEAIAAAAVGRAALLVTNSARAGAIALLLFALIPQTKLALGEALPDGAYMAAWARSTAGRRCATPWVSDSRSRPSCFRARSAGHSWWAFSRGRSSRRDARVCGRS